MTAFLLLAACTDEEPPPEPQHEADCRRDEDCEVVDVMCGGRAAAPPARAAELRRRWGERASTVGCVRAPWAPPELLAAACVAGQCVLDEIRWPELRACREDAECTAFDDDPCGPPTAVHRDHLADARRVIAVPERAASCATQAEALRALPDRAIDDGRQGLRCARGYCRR